MCSASSATPICIHYVTTTADAPALTDTSPANGIPDEVDRALATAESVHGTYVDSGYRRPDPDGSLGGGSGTVDIYLAQLGTEGLYGYCTTDQPIKDDGTYNYWAYCVIDDDYSSAEFPTNTPAENQQVTLAHEYFHAVQYAYDAFEDGWIIEATATWAEEQLYDGVDDNRQYLSASQIAMPFVPLDVYHSDGYQYGNWIFFQYLTERWPAETGSMPRLVLELWQRMQARSGSDPDRYSTQAVAEVLADARREVRERLRPVRRRQPPAGRDVQRGRLVGVRAQQPGRDQDALVRQPQHAGLVGQDRPPDQHPGALQAAQRPHEPGLEAPGQGRHARQDLRTRRPAGRLQEERRCLVEHAEVQAERLQHQGRRLQCEGTSSTSSWCWSTPASAPPAGRTPAVRSRAWASPGTSRCASSSTPASSAAERVRTTTRLRLGYAGIAAVDAWLAGSSSPGSHRARLVTKPLLMPVLAASLATDPAAARSPLRTSTLLAEGAAWVGDLALLGDRPDHYKVGAGAFAAGHASYVTGMVRQRSPVPLPGPRGIAGLWVITSPLLALFAAREERSLGAGLLAYSVSLAGMVAASTQLDRALPRSSRRLTQAGAALFMVSDALLGARRFVFRDPPARTETVVMATYTAGQVLLAEGAARASRRVPENAL